jgi:hypothetical protein
MQVILARGQDFSDAVHGHLSRLEAKIPEINARALSLRVVNLEREPVAKLGQ